MNFKIKKLLSQFKNSSFLLIGNEMISKSFSFVLFWMLGSILIKNEFADFIVEMPFVFLFSTVLSLGSKTYFLDQKRNKLLIFKSSVNKAYSIVLLINLLIILLVIIFYIVKIITLRSLLLMFLTVLVNLNYMHLERNFVFKQFGKMMISNFVPKFFSICMVYFFIDGQNLNEVYTYLIIGHLIIFPFIFVSTKFIDLTKIQILAYFRLCWPLVIQAILAYLGYVGYRFVLSIKSTTDDLIEFGVLQTYMGVFALLVSVSNRSMVLDLYDFLLKRQSNNILKNKMMYFHYLFMSFSILYCVVTIYFLRDTVGINVSTNTIISISVLVYASLLYYVSQYLSTVLSFNRDFKYLLLVSFVGNLSSLFFAVLISRIMIFELLPFAIFIVNGIMLIMYLKKLNGKIIYEILNVSLFIKFSVLLSIYFCFNVLLLNNVILFYFFNFCVFLITGYFIFKVKISKAKEKNVC